MKWNKINESFDSETYKKASDIKQILEGIIESIEVGMDSSYDIIDWNRILRKLNKVNQQVAILSKQQDEDFDN